MEELDITTTEKPKRPNFLVVLLVLSAISMVLSLSSVFSGLNAGPPTVDEREAYIADQYANINELRSQGLDGVADMFEELLEMTVYQNEHVYKSFYWLTLIFTIIGIVAVVFMFQLKKVGFHLYIIYSLGPIIISYLIIPLAMIPNFVIMGSLLLSLLFCVLYGLNLKYMK